MRITSKGQVTIPIQLREKAGFLPNTEVAFVLERGAVRIVRAKPHRGGTRGHNVVARLRGRVGGADAVREFALDLPAAEEKHEVVSALYRQLESAVPMPRGPLAADAWKVFGEVLEGIRHRELPVFAVQYHPEASPGPHDARPHFNEFVQLMNPTS